MNLIIRQVHSTTHNLCKVCILVLISMVFYSVCCAFFYVIRVSCYHITYLHFQRVSSRWPQSNESLHYCLKLESQFKVFMLSFNWIASIILKSFSVWVNIKLFLFVWHLASMTDPGILLYSVSYDCSQFPVSINIFRVFFIWPMHRFTSSNYFSGS